LTSDRVDGVGSDELNLRIRVASAGKSTPEIESLHAFSTFSTSSGVLVPQFGSNIAILVWVSETVVFSVVVLVDRTCGNFDALVVGWVIELKVHVL